MLKATSSQLLCLVLFCQIIFYSQQQTLSINSITTSITLPRQTDCTVEFSEAYSFTFFGTFSQLSFPVQAIINAGYTVVSSVGPVSATYDTRGFIVASFAAQSNRTASFVVRYITSSLLSVDTSTGTFTLPYSLLWPGVTMATAEMQIYMNADFYLSNVRSCGTATNKQVMKQFLAVPILICTTTFTSSGRTCPATSSANGWGFIGYVAIGIGVACAIFVSTLVCIGLVLLCIRCRRRRRYSSILRRRVNYFHDENNTPVDRRRRGSDVTVPVVTTNTIVTHQPKPSATKVDVPPPQVTIAAEAPTMFTNTEPQPILYHSQSPQEPANNSNTMVQLEPMSNSPPKNPAPATSDYSFANYNDYNHSSNNTSNYTTSDYTSTQHHDYSTNYTTHDYNTTTSNNYSTTDGWAS